MLTSHSGLGDADRSGMVLLAWSRIRCGVHQVPGTVPPLVSNADCAPGPQVRLTPALGGDGGGGPDADAAAAPHFCCTLVVAAPGLAPRGASLAACWGWPQPDAVPSNAGAVVICTSNSSAFQVSKETKQNCAARRRPGCLLGLAAANAVPSTANASFLPPASSDTSSVRISPIGCAELSPCCPQSNILAWLCVCRLGAAGVQGAVGGGRGRRRPWHAPPVAVGRRPPLRRHHERCAPQRCLYALSHVMCWELRVGAPCWQTSLSNAHSFWAAAFL